MNFTFSAEDSAFEKEVDEFVKREVTKEVVQEVLDGQGYGPHSWTLLRKLGFW